MRKVGIIFLVLFFVTVSGWAGVVEEASQNIQKEKHDALVVKAQILLKAREITDARLVAIQERLLQLERGEDADVNLPGDCSSGQGFITFGN